MKRINIISITGATLLLALVVYGLVSSSSTASADVSSATVTMKGSQFHPKTLTISKGTEVTWLNDDTKIHTATSDNGVWDTKDIKAGEKTTTTFNTVGTFPYSCVYHDGMVGTIVVQ